MERLRPEDFTKKKIENIKLQSLVENSKSPQSKITEGLQSPRGAF